MIIIPASESIIVQDSTYLEPSSLSFWYSELSQANWLEEVPGIKERTIPIKEKDIIVTEFSHSLWFSHIFNSHIEYERTDPFAISVFSTFFFCLKSYLESYDTVPDLHLNSFKYITGKEASLFNIVKNLFDQDDLIVATSLSDNEIVLIGEEEYVLNSGDTVVCPAIYFKKYTGPQGATSQFIVASMSRL
jgi:hypothetical protein